jgi:hypothetical protein
LMRVRSGAHPLPRTALGSYRVMHNAAREACPTASTTERRACSSGSGAA